MTSSSIVVPESLTSNMIKNGYYRVGDQIFANKIRALIEGSKRNMEIEWIFNQDIFNGVDWSIEPHQSIDELYRERARQLRSQYDYVILLYSAGVDSQTVFDSFAQIGSPVDELFITWPVSAADKMIVDPADRSSYNAVAEWTFLIKPQLDVISKLYPEIQITIVDCSQLLISEQQQYKEDDIFFLDNFVNIPGLNRWSRTYQDLRQILDRHPNSVVITGHDKPQFKVKNNDLYLFFGDASTNLKSQPGIDIEFFYWAPDSTALLRKQSHLALKYFRERPELRSCLRSKSDLMYYHINTAVYPGFDPGRYQAAKQQNVLLNEQFTWIWDTSEMKNSQIMPRWKSHLRSLNSDIRARYHRRNDFGFDGYIPFTTPDYYIGSFGGR